MMEYALEAELNYVFGQHGCVPSYNSIVGGGGNGCILHYVENNQPLKDGDLVLMRLVNMSIMPLILPVHFR